MRTLLYILPVAALALGGCADFLDAKPDRSLAIPDNLKDLQALLDYEDRMNLYHPAAGDIASDFYYLKEADWQSRTVSARETYVWDPDAEQDSDWSLGYERIFFANVVLDGIQEAELGPYSEADRRNVEGQASFFRGYSFYTLAQLFCPYYAIGQEDNPYGLPLKLSADINEPIVRASLVETYEQLIHDLKRSAQLLPVDQVSALRPNKAAAYATLARVYLTIQDYPQALAYADSCLAIRSELIDYNTVDATLAQPFPVLNPEVLFHAIISTSTAMHNQARAYVDSLAVGMYGENDLRAPVFLQEEADGRYRFKGSYSGSRNSLFGGIALDEVYLIKAESSARLDRFEDARNALRTLLITRWKDGAYEMPAVTDGPELIRLILREREKELLFRGALRWSDLRRLNTDPQTARTLERKLDKTYSLPPGDPRYTFLIPWTVIQHSGMEQNPRE